MKTSHLLATFAAATIAANTLAIASETASATKDHILFVGSDFSVVVKGQEHPVIGAGERTFVFQEGSNRREKPLRELPNIRIHRGLKLTNVTARIDKLEAVLSSDARMAEANDAAMDAMAMATLADIQRDNAYGKMIQADIGRMGAGSSQNTSVRGHDVSVGALEGAGGIQDQAYRAAIAAQQQYTQQMKFFQQHIETTGAASTNDGEEVEISPELDASGAGLSVSGRLPHLSIDETKGKQQHIVKAVVDTGNGRSDHLDLNFQLSAPRPLDTAYVVVTTEYTTEKSNEVFRRVLTKRVGHLDATPRKISIYETNYPEGFHLRTYVIGVYANGQEVATNLSDTKMTMTRDEAYEYISIDYLASHKGKSSPPAAVLMVPRSELVNALGKSIDADQPLYVSVDDNGKVTRISADPKHTQAPSPAAVSALDNFRFIPALDNGKPVAGRAKIILADFVQ